MNSAQSSAITAVVCTTIIIGVLTVWTVWSYGHAERLRASEPQVHIMTASWVTSRLHGYTMANGRPFDRGAFTARVPKGLWPLGTWLVITGPTGTRIAVEVTDWCGTQNRIDLSEAAFMRLASLGQGITDITVKTL